MASLLPLELLQTLKQACPCRETQVQQLATYFNPTFPSPPTLVLHGLDHTGKLQAAAAVLRARQIPHALVRCRECLSQRHLLCKIFAGCVRSLGDVDVEVEVEVEGGEYEKIDSINALVSALQRLWRGRKTRFVVVLEGVDRQRGMGATLLPALARLGDLIPNLSTILISTSPRALTLHKAGVPYIYFPPYTRSEALALLNDTFPSSSLPIRKLQRQFTAAVYDSLIAPTASTSLPVFKSTCAKLWPRFIYNGGEEAKEWDFGRLMVRNRALFQAEGEAALVDRLLPSKEASTFERLQAVAAAHGASSVPAPTATTTTTTTSAPNPNPNPPLLKQAPTLLLLATYLASYTPPKHDLLLFSRLSASSKSAKTRRRKLTSSTPTSIAVLSAPRPFPLDRALAIHRAIHPHGVANRKSVADRLYREMAELERLRLVVCVGSAGEEGEERWRVNVGREMVEQLGRRWGVGIREYELD